MIQNTVVDYHPVHLFSPLSKVLVAGTDFKLNAVGNVKGYSNPANELVVGVSSFDSEPIVPEEYGVIHSAQYFEPCSILMSVPNGVKLVQDYQIALRLKKLHKKLVVMINHYSIFPVDDVTLAEWQEIIHVTQILKPQSHISCKWQPCVQNSTNDTEFSDGSEDEDVYGLRDFGIHALYQLSKFLFPSANLHDKIHLNGMLTLIATHKEQSFDFILSLNMPFMRAIYCILYNNNVTLPSSLCNFAGIVLAKLEATFGTLSGLKEEEEDDDESF
jgi:hypothetical protein